MPRLKLHKRWAIAMGIVLSLMGTTLTRANAPAPTDNLCAADNWQRPSATVIADQLGWVASLDNRCGGYYLEPAFLGSDHLLKKDVLQINSSQGLIYSLHGTSISQGKITITQNGQQIIANKGYLYRDPTTQKFSSVDMLGHVTLREPNSLILASCGHLDLLNKSKSLRDILYRTAIYSHDDKSHHTFDNQMIQQEHKVSQLSARGEAKSFTQDQPHVYHFQNASYTTCPPLAAAWQVRARDIELNKDTGRGVAKSASLLVKGVPVAYTPYLNFPIDARRQTGFLWPRVGSNQSGPYLGTPFYWNLAPNYDDLITPTYLGKRGLQIDNLYRYLMAHPESNGNLDITILPDDRLFNTFKQTQFAENVNSTDTATQSELNRLMGSSNTRTALSWQDNTRFNEHWGAKVDYNYVGDDYYLTDFRNNLDVITPNQLLQEADVTYNAQHWNFLGRVQGYQTLHPVNQNPFYNQYTRLPQLVLNGNYPNEHNLDYFVENDFSHFDIQQNPGSTQLQPIGNRLNVQPGVSLPLYRPAFYINPRVQFAMTEYDVGHVAEPNFTHPSRTLPIFDIDSGLYFDRNVNLFKHAMQQTLEPRLYYTYVPYRDQNDLPIFDTTLNTLTYDQLFTWNRFTGLDRIGNANQISAGLATRFIDQESGFQKIYAGIGQIFYFTEQRVGLCSNNGYPNYCPATLPPEAKYNRSPLSGVFTYNLTPTVAASADTIWDSQAHQLNNQTFTLNYRRDELRILNFSYSFARSGDVQGTVPQSSSVNNLSQTDFSFTWPLTRDWATIGRWTQNWNRDHFKNLLYGLQYNSCCWAVQFVTGRTFTSLTPNNTYQYNTEFYIQFALKGLGNIGNGNPTLSLSSPTGSVYQPNFGQDY